MNDIEIAKEIALGNQNVFEDFFNEHKLKVMNLCYGMTHNKDNAEDLVQDIFLEIYSSAKTFQGKSKLSTWLYRIAFNKTINYLRKEKIKNLFVSIDNSNQWLLSDDRADLSIEEKEKIDTLHKVIDKLPSKQKQAIILFVYDELPQKEIAEIMDCSLASVEVLIHRAKKLIKNKTDIIYGNVIEKG